MRIVDHPVLGRDADWKPVTIYVDGRPLLAREGEVIAAALAAAGIRACRTTPRLGQPRGIYCAIGQCTDCVMTVNGSAGVRTCITPVAAGMQIESGSVRDEQT